MAYMQVIKKGSVNMDRFNKDLKQLYAQKKWFSASNFITNALLHDPNNCKILMYGVELEEKIKNFGTAKCYAKRLLKANKNWEFGFWNTARLQKITGDLLAAKQTVEAGLKENPKCEKLLELKGELDGNIFAREQELSVSDTQSGRVTRSQSAKRGIQHVALGKNIPENIPENYIPSKEEQEIIKKAHDPALMMLEFVKKHAALSDPNTLLEDILDKCEEEYCKLPVSNEVRFLYGDSLIWSGSGKKLPTFNTSECWKKLTVDKRLPISCILFFSFNGWLAFIARSFLLEGCEEKYKKQIQDIEDDHAYLLEQMVPGVSCYGVNKIFREHVKRKYEGMTVNGKKVQVPKIKKIGAGFYGEKKWVGDLELKSCGTRLMSGMGFFTCITYSYLDTDTRDEFPVLYGDTVLLSRDGGKVVEPLTFEREEDAESFELQELEELIQSDEMQLIPSLPDDIDPRNDGNLLILEDLEENTEQMAIVRPATETQPSGHGNDEREAGILVPIRTSAPTTNDSTVTVAYQYLGPQTAPLDRQMIVIFQTPLWLAFQIICATVSTHQNRSRIPILTSRGARKTNEIRSRELEGLPIAPSTSQNQRGSQPKKTTGNKTGFRMNIASNLRYAFIRSKRFGANN